MSLLTEELEITLNVKQIKYYENLGYNIPRRKDKRGEIHVKRGTKIEVKIEDLQKGSSAKVKIKCDECGKEYDVKYFDYLRCLHEDGKIYCNKCASKLFNSRENNANYNTNLTDDEREQGRNIEGYYDFIQNVYKRDNYTCQCCGDNKGKNLVVHHLDGYNWCKEKRINEVNGITLCEICHNNFHLKYGKGNNTKEQFEEWIGHTIELLEYDGELSTTKKIKDLTTNEIYNSAEECAKMLKVKQSTNIRNICNHNSKESKRVQGHVLMWLEEYNNMSKKEIEDYIKECNTNNKYAKVICLTTNKKFNSMVDGGRYYNIHPSNISQCCRHIREYAGFIINENGEKVNSQWEYFYEYNESMEN